MHVCNGVCYMLHVVCLDFMSYMDVFRVHVYDLYVFLSYRVRSLAPTSSRHVSMCARVLNACLECM